MLFPVVWVGKVEKVVRPIIFDRFTMVVIITVGLYFCLFFLCIYRLHYL